MYKFMLLPVLLIFSTCVEAMQCEVPTPAYPDDLSLQGTAQIRVHINQDGNVSDSEVFKSSGSDLLDKSALQASLKIRCKPFLENGKPISVTAIQPYVFSNKFEEREALDKEIISIIRTRGLGVNSKIAKRMGCYMPEAKRLNLDEIKPKIPSVIIQVGVDAEGKYLSSEIVRGSDKPELNEAALAASKLFSCPLKGLRFFVHAYHFL
jgi:TonB family protein